MDLIPEPLDSLPPVLIPLSDNIIPYDFGDFATFPQRHGFGQDKASLVGLSPTERTRLIQSWLLFGIIAIFLEENPDLEEFTIPMEGGEPSATRNLSLKHLKLLPSRYPDDYDYEPDKKMLFALKHAWVIVNWMNASGMLDTSLTGATGLAVLMVIQTIHQLEDPVKIWVGPWDSYFLRSHLHTAGWCPQQVQQLICSKDIIFACYAARLRIPNPRDISHSHCTTLRCTAYNVTLGSTYVVRHEHYGCQCDMVEVDSTKVKDIIRGGSIPLVSVQQDSEGRISLHVEKATARSMYVAISHVWSDGLGNPTANAMPACQLRRLLKKMNALPREVNSDQPTFGFQSFGGLPPVPIGSWSLDIARMGIRQHNSPNAQLFWIDTLCIPVGTDPEVPLLKQKAINQMAAVYAAAFQVLILDSAVERARIGAATTNELLCRLAFSAWMRRCWTFQEGAVARRAYFQCADGAATPLHLGYNRNRLFPHRSLRHFTFAIRNNPLRTSLRRIFRDSGSGMFTKRDIDSSPFFIRPVLSGINNILVGSDPIKRRETDRIEQQIYRTAFEYFTSSMQLLHRGAFTNSFSAENGAKKRTNWGTAGAVSQVSHFCLVWNNLAQRSTTMAEDILVIMANVMDYSAYDILKLPAEQRVKALLCNMEVLPVSLLFNDGTRLRTAKDRWIPRFPSSYVLEEAPTMRLSNNKLILSSDDAETAVLFILRAPVTELSRFRVAMDDTEFVVDLIRDESDESQEFYADNSSNFTALVFARKPTGYHDRCAVFSITRTRCVASSPNEDLEVMELTDLTSAKLVVEGIYDCPAHVYSVQTEAHCQYPLIDGSARRDDWELVANCETDTFAGKYPQRPHYTVLASASWVAIFLFFSSFAILLFVIGNLLRLAEEVHIPWTARTTLAKVSLVIWAVQFIPPLLYFMLPLAIPVILLIVDRVQTKTPFDGLTVGYIVGSLSLNPIVALAFTISSFPAVVSIAYRSWLQTFYPEWPSKSALLLRLVLHARSVQRGIYEKRELVPKWMQIRPDDPDKVGGMDYLFKEAEKLEKKARFASELIFDPGADSTLALVRCDKPKGNISDGESHKRTGRK
ncbi:hypothetical protein BX600DRAFT_519001 [Xylariales sp. PMI_506]|nr:hypothetical protein BX600DRAFT_519001 [Xylariales sp. PMI_506]